MINYLVDVLAYVRLYYLIMIGANYVTEAPIVSLYINIMGYSLLHHGVHGIWIWSIWFVGIIWIWHQSYGIASCCIALHWHMKLCREPIVLTVPIQHRLLGTTMELHTLLGMKAGVHMHPCAYIIGLA